MTDIVTGWTECRTTWSKGSQGVLALIQAVEALLPFLPAWRQLRRWF
jgi:hypothetical protein